MKYGIVGMGRMGKAVAKYIDANAKVDDEIVCIDRDISMLSDVGNMTNHRVRSISGGVENILNEKLDVVIATCGYEHYVDALQCCIKTKTHMVDLGGNIDVVKKQFALNDNAKNAGITVIPDQGLAPGLVNVVAMMLFKKLDSFRCKNIDIKIRVGGLPRLYGEDNPFKYTMTWSADGLINEYVVDAEEIRKHKKTIVKSLSDLETLYFDNPFDPQRYKFEAFVTSGGSSNLPTLLEGRVRNLSYKTMRYPGHYAAMKSLEYLGLLTTHRKLITDVVSEKLSMVDNDDLVFARIEASGDIDSTIESKCIDITCESNPVMNLSAMAQTTGFSAAIVAMMIANNEINETGVLCGEAVIDGKLLLDRLQRCGIRVLLE